MKRSDRHARTLTLLADLEVLKTANLTNGWRTRLEFYAEQGWPTGGDHTGGNHDINRPTERFALAPTTEPARMLRDLERLEQQVADAAKGIRAIYLYVTQPAKYDGPEPRPCINLECDHTITMIGNDRARYGLCHACYMREYRKQKNGEPNLIDRHNTPAA